MNGDAQAVLHLISRFAPNNRETSNKLPTKNTGRASLFLREVFLTLPGHWPCALPRSSCFALFALKGPRQISPGQGNASIARIAVALGNVFRRPESPERAQQGARGSPVSPFQGLRFLVPSSQGGASRLRRCALPWADLCKPLQGRLVETCVKPQAQCGR